MQSNSFKAVRDGGRDRGGRLGLEGLVTQREVRPEGDRDVVPKGHHENSPAFQRRDRRTQDRSS